MQKHEYEWELNRKIAKLWSQEREYSDFEVLLKGVQNNRRVFGCVSVVFLLMGICTVFWQVLPEFVF